MNKNKNMESRKENMPLNKKKPHDEELQKTYKSLLVYVSMYLCVFKIQ